MNHELHPPRLMSDMNADPPRQNAFSGGRGGVGLKTRVKEMAIPRFQCDIPEIGTPYITLTGGYVDPISSLERL